MCAETENDHFSHIFFHHVYLTYYSTHLLENLCVRGALSLVSSATVVRVSITLRKPRRCMLKASDWSSLPGDQWGRGCIRKCCFSLYPWCNLNDVVSCVESTWGAASWGSHLKCLPKVSARSRFRYPTSSGRNMVYYTVSTIKWSL